MNAQQVKELQKGTVLKSKHHGMTVRLERQYLDEWYGWECWEFTQLTDRWGNESFPTRKWTTCRFLAQEWTTCSFPQLLPRID